MSLPRIITLLRQTIGLDVATVGVGIIERAVKKRLSATDLQDDSEYAQLLQSSDAEWRRLVETVVIPETFFFRYPHSYGALRQIAEDRFLLGNRKLRVLSAPCSTGEEPYSIAVTLLEAGLSSANMQIDAIDISAHLLDIAKRGLFGGNSFRGVELTFRDQYFEGTKSGFQLCDRVRQCVNFRQGNVLEERFLAAGEPYDFIFFRNLLIYFDPGAQGKALRSLWQCLRTDGILFVGSAETSLLAEHGFISAKLAMAFAFHKHEPVLFPTLPKPRRAKARRTEVAPKSVLATTKKPVFEVAAPENKLSLDLAFAEQLADKGEFQQAVEICEVYLREEGPSARAFHLLALIRDSAGDQQQASDFYRKALYLEPDHYDALVHLALLKDKSGDSAGAKTLKSRARRALERTK
jgi:chemotaxis protein methyltransferase WspC